MFQANLFCKARLIKTAPLLKHHLLWSSPQRITAGDFYLFPTPSHSTKKKDSCRKVLTHP